MTQQKMTCSNSEQARKLFSRWMMLPRTIAVVSSVTTNGRISQHQSPSRNTLRDGDWCWEMRPFVVTEETTAMVRGNIIHLLNSFLACSEFEHVIFCWVMHTQEILDDLLGALN